jgi:hypothetical protein
VQGFPPIIAGLQRRVVGRPVGAPVVVRCVAGRLRWPRRQVTEASGHDHASATRFARMGDHVGRPDGASCAGTIFDPTGRTLLIILGIILLVLGFVLSVPVLWTIGIILVVIGVVLALVGSAGRAVGGRKHWY